MGGGTAQEHPYGVVGFIVANLKKQNKIVFTYSWIKRACNSNALYLQTASNLARESGSGSCEPQKEGPTSSADLDVVVGCPSASTDIEVPRLAGVVGTGSGGCITSLLAALCTVDS